MKLTAALAVSVAFLATAAMAQQTEPPICDPADTLPTGEQGIESFGGISSSFRKFVLFY